MDFLILIRQPETAFYLPQSPDRNILLNPLGKTIEARVPAPAGYSRFPAEKNSFGSYLRNLPLKPHGSFVTLYDGRKKPNNNVYDAVVDLKIGDKNLHQCADAIMRLRAEYLWNNKQFDKIHFNFTNGFRADYSKWMSGKRISVNGNKTFWTSGSAPSNTYAVFWKYMEVVFSYAGTLSLAKELKPAAISNIQIGDVFIQGGSPGHAVIVTDIAVNSKTGKTIFLLAQSYMPAQEIQILKNPLNKEISPWYETGFGSVLETPEWTFSKNDLKRFEN